MKKENLATVMLMYQAVVALTMSSNVVDYTIRPYGALAEVTVDVVNNIPSEISEDEALSKVISSNKETREKVTVKNQVNLQKNKRYDELKIVSENSVSQAMLIDSEMFNTTQVRLNSELYHITDEVFNKEHIINEYGVPTTNLYKSYMEYINPIIPLALTVCETGGWADSRYTWCSAIYSDLLRGSGVDLNMTKIESVNVDTYVVNGLCTYLGCGRNCSAGENTHYHTVGNNDNDSLGPLQILRHYVEEPGSIEFDCGESTSDLMCWKDNVEYFTHRQSDAYSNAEHWNAGYSIQNDNELVALIGVGHNTGLAFQNSEYAGSTWLSSKAVYEYCRVIGSVSAEEVLTTYIDNWWEDVKVLQSNGERFYLAGQLFKNDTLNSILQEVGVEKSTYASDWGHKQMYPLKAILNYMSLERLYSSGKE